jgi:ABC-type transport system involved in cytochrome bd biosynthesis fused ATPase/permease subunit
MLGIKLANTVNMLIYEKSLKYSPIADKKFAEAEILNYSQTDVERFTYIGYHLSAMVYGPIQIVFGLIMIFFFIGASFFAGLALLILILLVNYQLIKKVTWYNE